MRLLCLTPRLPWPPDRGDRLRAHHLLATFTRDHRVTLLTACEGRAEADAASELEGMIEAVHTVRLPPALSVATAAVHAWRSLPLQALYYRSARLRRALLSLDPGSFDAVYLHLFRLAPYLFPRPEGGLHRIVDLTDVVSGEIARSLPFRGPGGRLLYAHEGRRIGAYEDLLARRAEEIWVVSETEREALLERSPRAPVRLVPNGVDTALFAPDGSAAVAGRMLFVGHLGVAHNADAARFLVDAILPRVRSALPGAGLRLVGAGATAALARRGRRQGVEVAGYVPDLPAELRRAAVFIAPLRFSAGAQNKVLEAMATGRPVVTTPRVARGLEATPGTHLLVGDDAASLAEATLRVLRDTALAAELGRAARRHVAGRFTWEHARRRLADLETELAGRQLRL